tara:strand:+ start:98 stop:508 length:411 start_codon:yes stop_codon:yes gene_type:complete
MNYKKKYLKYKLKYLNLRNKFSGGSSEYDFDVILYLPPDPTAELNDLIKRKNITFSEADIIHNIIRTQFDAGDIVDKDKIVVTYKEIGLNTKEVNITETNTLNNIKDKVKNVFDKNIFDTDNNFVIEVRIEKWVDN